MNETFTVVTWIWLRKRESLNEKKTFLLGPVLGDKQNSESLSSHRRTIIKYNM